MKRNQRIRRWNVFLFLSLLSMASWAQTQISGTVVSTEDGLPIPGANIIIKGTSTGTTTDFDGNYILSAAAEDILVVSYLGYKTVEKRVGNQSAINFSMESEAQVLDDVVVVGYSSTRKTDLTGAIAQVTAKSFEEQPLTRVENALQGRAAGVQVTRATGTPGGRVKIRIRGGNSITGSNDPLVVIDGIIGGDLTSLNTNDIASMDILKDASATAIYGSRGANGVIIINTKKGSGDAKVDIELFTSVNHITKRIDLLSPEQYADLYGTTVVDGGTDYQDEYLRTALSKNLQLSVSGKEGKIGYFVSGNYTDQEGNVINNEYERLTLRTNLNIDVTDRLSVGLNVFGSREKALNRVANGLRAENDSRYGIVAALAFDPTLPIYNSDGTPNINSTLGSIGDNPILLQRDRRADNIRDRLNTNLNLNYKFTPSFNYTALVGASVSNVSNETYQGLQALKPTGFASAGGGSTRSTNFQLSNILTWNKEFGKHQIKLVGVYEVQSQQSRIKSLSAGNFIFPADFNQIELGENPRVGANFTESSLESLVAQADYSFNNSLFIKGTIRQDASSRFRDGNRTGVFPSASVAYSLRESALIKNSNTFSDIKLRAGYGETGNQDIPPYSTFPFLDLGNNFPFDGSSLTVGLVPGRFENPDLTWETTKQINVGADFALFSNRLRLTLDWYKKSTEDLLLDVPVPTFAGGGSVLRNIGEVENKGFDISLDAFIVNNDDFRWNSTFTLSSNESEVVALADDQEQIISGVAVAGAIGNTHIVRRGEQLGSIYGATFLGTYKTADQAPGIVPGTSRYALDEDGAVAFDIIGNGVPDFTWGFNNTFTYKDFDFNVFFVGGHGFDVLNATRGLISLPTGNVLNASNPEFLNRWTPTNETDIPASGTNIVPSTRFLEKGDFVRLSNLSLSYNVPIKQNLRSLKLSLSAQNLFIITDYTGYDPEASSFDTDRGAGLDYGAIPNPRSITFGINIGI